MQYRNIKMPMPTDRGILSVNGTSSIETKPDIALLNAGVTTENKDLEKAKDENHKIYNNILISLSDYGIPSENIYNEDISITRNYDYTNNTLLSYKVTSTIKIIIKNFSILNDVYSLIIANGANDNINLNFLLSDPSYYYNKALKKASHDALNKASLLAKSFGVKYNPTPHKIKENSSPLYSITYPSSSNCNYSSNVSPGLIKIIAEIEVIFTTYIY